MASIMKSNMVHPDGGGGSPYPSHPILKQPRQSLPVVPVSYSDGEYYDHVSTSPFGGRESRTPKLPVPSDCPKGLEALVHLEHLFIKHSHLVTEFFLNAANKFEILDSESDFVYLAAETTPPLTRIFCFGGYPFELAINTLPGNSTYTFNSRGKDVLQLKGSCGSCGCGSEVTVTMGNKTLGSVEQEGDCLRPSYSVKNADKKELLIIQGPDKPHCFACGFGSSFFGIDNNSSNSGKNQADLIKFEILLPESKIQVGRIARQHVPSPQQSTATTDISRKTATPSPFHSNAINGMNRRQSIRNLQHQRRESIPVPSSTIMTMTRTRENELWGVKFPLDLDVTTKALLLSAAYLLEYQYYNE